MRIACKQRQRSRLRMVALRRSPLRMWQGVATLTSRRIDPFPCYLYHFRNRVQANQFPSLYLLGETTGPAPDFQNPARRIMPLTIRRHLLTLAKGSEAIDSVINRDGFCEVPLELVPISLPDFHRVHGPPPKRPIFGRFPDRG